jgi:hypothetical protein
MRMLLPVCSGIINNHCRHDSRKLFTIVAEILESLHKLMLAYYILYIFSAIDVRTYT